MAWVRVPRPVSGVKPCGGGHGMLTLGRGLLGCGTTVPRRGWKGNAPFGPLLATTHAGIGPPRGGEVAANREASPGGGWRVRIQSERRGVRLIGRVLIRVWVVCPATRLRGTPPRVVHDEKQTDLPLVHTQRQAA